MPNRTGSVEAVPWQHAIKGQGALSVMLLVVLLLASHYAITQWRRPPYPPGPKGHPLLGMTFLMPKERPWVQYTEWARTYGKLMYFRLGGTSVIVVSSGRIAKEMLHHRYQKYSSRPPSVVGEIVTRNMRSVLLPYGDHLKRVRRHYTKFISAAKCDGYLPVQEKEAIASIMDISKSPDDFELSITRYSVSSARSIAFGKRVENAGDPFARDVNRVIKQFAEIMTPGKYMVDFIPALQLLPRFLRPWMDHLEAYRDWETVFFLNEYRQALKDAEKYPNRPSLARDINEERKVLGQTDATSELQAAQTCMEILGTGSDTISGSIRALIHACLAYPDVLKKAHKELDRVIGRDRFPTWEDEPNLPYIRAMIKEQHRWRTIAPLSFAHYASEDDVIDNYYIPKGSLVQINTWAIQMDPERYPDPERFEPERFLNYPLSASAYANNPNPDERDHFSYGGGRRVCIGLHLAERSLYSMISRFLHTFDIKPGLDEDGNEIPIDVDAYTTSLTSFAKPFKARFMVRNPQIQKTLENEWTKLFGHGQVESWVS
ncbi:hypothetical protein NW765_017631 [Fusarium oxysporum]|nr:hypothetical protein NW765_017631 [Fusarium oxysporum]KAJ4264142.1 hypothetical protein NW764_015950 [Fusarium oxysporum]